MKFNFFLYFLFARIWNHFVPFHCLAECFLCILYVYSIRNTLLWSVLFRYIWRNLISSISTLFRCVKCSGFFAFYRLSIQHFFFFFFINQFRTILIFCRIEFHLFEHIKRRSKMRSFYINFYVNIHIFRNNIVFNKYYLYIYLSYICITKII